MERRGRYIGDKRMLLIDRDVAARLPRSLHHAGRRTKSVRKKKPARSGRDDNREEKHVFSEKAAEALRAWDALKRTPTTAG
jgi:hypothetical protein